MTEHELLEQVKREQMREIFREVLANGIGTPRRSGWRQSSPSRPSWTGSGGSGGST